MDKMGGRIGVVSGPGQGSTFWIEIADNLDSDVSIFIYYGNTDCTTTSSGEATFVFFDDTVGEGHETPA